VRRAGHLFEKVIAYDNLLAAFRLARRGCGNTPEACRFFFYLEPELLRLQDELQAGRYQPGAYWYFTIHDPKERVIAVAPFRDRVVHHAIVRVLTPVYEPAFIFDSYATRPGKGTHAAIVRTQQFLRRFRWYLKTDIAKYFERVDHEFLLGLLQRKLKDRRMLDLLERIIHNSPTPGKGLPIGNLTSQFLANVYLDPLDHDLKDTLGLRGYVRYMDDMVCFSDSKPLLREVQVRIEDFLCIRLALSLKPSATQLNRASHGLSFLGMRLFRRAIRVKPENRRRSLRRLRQALSAWQLGDITEEHMQQSLTSIVGHLRYFCPGFSLPVVL
jgi:hypothetical protein